MLMVGATGCCSSPYSEVHQLVDIAPPPGEGGGHPGVGEGAGVGVGECSGGAAKWDINRPCSTENIMEN